MSFQDAKIVDYLGDDKFVVEIKQRDTECDYNPLVRGIIVAHDYVRFSGPCHFEITGKKENGEPVYQSKTGASNWVQSSGSVTIGIRDMIEMVMPYLSKHKYMQQDHISDRVHTEDDKYFKDKGLDKPRYKEGDKYPSYAFSACIIEYYDSETNTNMVAFRRVGEKIYEHVTRGTFEKIKDHLKLCLRKDEVK